MECPNCNSLKTQELETGEWQCIECMEIFTDKNGNYINMEKYGYKEIKEQDNG